MTDTSATTTTTTITTTSEQVVASPLSCGAHSEAEASPQASPLSITEESKKRARLELADRAFLASKRRIASQSSLADLELASVAIEANHDLSSTFIPDRDNQGGDRDDSRSDNADTGTKLSVPIPPAILSPHLRAASVIAADAPSEFLSQLFVIYMPKTNFKRFIIASPSTNIIRAPKTERQSMPRQNFPSLSSPTVRPPIVGPSTIANKKISDKPLTADDYTYNVSMEDILSCLESHSVSYNRKFIWIDLFDNGLKFIQSMKDCEGSAAAGGGDGGSNEEIESKQNSQGLWHNVVHKSHLIAHHLNHPILGEGYAVVITLELNEQAPSASQSQSSEPCQTVEPAVSESLNRMKAEPAVAADSSVPVRTETPRIQSLSPPPMDSPLAAPTISTVDTKRTAPSAGSDSHTSQHSSSNAKRKIRPVESIGEMLDRIAEYQRIRLQAKSKNKACEKLGYSKGTINAYREKVKAALSLGIDLNSIRKTKYRDFKRVLLAAQKNSANNAANNQQSFNISSSTKDRQAKREEKLRKRSNSFGDLGMALMTKQDQANGSGRCRRKYNSDSEEDGGEGNSSSDDEDNDTDTSTHAHPQQQQQPLSFALTGAHTHSLPHNHTHAISSSSPANTRFAYQAQPIQLMTTETSTLSQSSPSTINIASVVPINGSSSSEAGMQQPTHYTLAYTSTSSQPTTTTYVLNSNGTATPTMMQSTPTIFATAANSSGYYSATNGGVNGAATQLVRANVSYTPIQTQVLQPHAHQHAQQRYI